MTISISVHRFHNSAGLSVMGTSEGRTVYLTAKQARSLARALTTCARSIEGERFADSKVGTHDVSIGEGTPTYARKGYPVLVIRACGVGAYETLKTRFSSWSAKPMQHGPWYEMQAKGISYDAAQALIASLGIRATVRVCRCHVCASGRDCA